MKIDDNVYLFDGVTVAVNFSRGDNGRLNSYVGSEVVSGDIE